MKTPASIVLFGLLVSAGAQAKSKVQLPGKCVEIPDTSDTGGAEDDYIASYDFDGDGTSDTLVKSKKCRQTGGDKYDCAYDLYILRDRRGSEVQCGHYVGSINLGRDGTIELAKTVSHGLRDVTVRVYTSVDKYKFNGKTYVLTSTAGGTTKRSNGE
jgi:hypothetical protein